jgi:hypothetical protein
MKEIPFVLDRYMLECAFRKAKTELFYDRTATLTNEIIEYQEKLYENLTALQLAFKDGNFTSFFENHPIRIGFIAKKLNLPKVPTNGNHIFHSSLEKSGQIENIIADSTAELRKIALFPFEIHLLSAYWVMTIGSKFDSRLSQNSYASRLSRLNGNEVHTTKLSLFKPYFYDYDNWRKGSLLAIERALKNDENIAVMTFDFSAYYHNINPLFLLETDYLERFNINLNSRELEFTKAFINYIRSWNTSEKSFKSLPIGLTMSSLIANIFLADFDREIEREISPVYYGRYMDDLILAIHTSPEKISNQESFINHIGEKVSYFKGVKPSRSGEFTLKSPNWALGSKLKFNSKKQKLFILYGESGLDLIDNIATTIDEISSERRLLPKVDSLTRSKAAMTLATSDGKDVHSDTLRKADGLTLRRFGWSVLLRSAQLLGSTLKPDEWQRERTDFCTFAQLHVLNPLTILNNTAQLPRLLSIFVSNRDWNLVKKVLINTRESLFKLNSASIIINSGRKQKPNGTIQIFMELFDQKIVDAMLRSIDINVMSQKDYIILSEILAKLNHNLSDTSTEYLEKYILSVHMIDFGLHPVNEPGIYKLGANLDWSNNYLSYFGFNASIQEFFNRAQNSFAVNNSATIIPIELVNRDFLTKTIAYPTRPLKPSQIFNILQHTSISVKVESISFLGFRNIVAAFRGTWLQDQEGEVTGGNNSLITHLSEDQSKSTMIEIGIQEDDSSEKNRTIGLSHLLTTDMEWSATAANNPNLSTDRYNRIAEIVNQAIKAKIRPDYLILPELAIPISAINSIASRLEHENINLILGAEYSHFTDKSGTRKVFSTAELFLFDKRLGYNGFLQVTQRKGLPAPHEEKGLLKLHSLEWDNDKSSKPIYLHNGYQFGVLICSELQNIRHRKSFQGTVDTLFILSWNKDLETFNALIEASALDIHAYIALVNNRRYGDSRLRVPFKIDYKRDVFRIKGGKNEMLGVAEIDFRQLRRFQSKTKRWSEPSDLFKPVPEDFELNPTRWMIPD